MDKILRKISLLKKYFYFSSKTEKMDSREEILYKQLGKFYSNKKNLDDFYKIRIQRKPCSIRVYEYFVMTYCKNTSVEYKVNGKIFNVYCDYKNNQLASYNKKFFDPCRRSRFIELKHPDGIIETTLAQMNFFRWVLKNKITEHLVPCLDVIKRNMKPDKEQTINVDIVKTDKNGKSGKVVSSFADKTARISKDKIVIYFN